MQYGFSHCWKFNRVFYSFPNFFYFTEILQQKAIEGGALDVVEQYLQHYQLEEGLCNMVLVTVGSLTDSG